MDSPHPQRNRIFKRGPIRMVNAWATEDRLILGQVRTADTSDEITAIPELLRVVGLIGCIAPINATGCQKAIAARVVEQGAETLLRQRRTIALYTTRSGASSLTASQRVWVWF